MLIKKNTENKFTINRQLGALKPGLKNKIITTCYYQVQGKCYISNTRSTETWH